MLPVADFGRTGHRSTRVIFGAAGLGGMSQTRADATLALAAERGVNHIDTAASYGASEDRLRPWLATNRAGVFLATKTGERTGCAARAELERSLERMGVDHVDLIQLHNLVEPDEWDVAFAPDGAVAALARARDEGLVRFIGVTGHGLRIAEMHRRSLERFDFDSVLLPYNFSLMQIAGYRADVDALRAVCAERSVAVQTIKSIARRVGWRGRLERRTTAGTSRSPTVTRSLARCASCSASPSCSSTRRATLACFPRCSTRRSGRSIGPPTTSWPPTTTRSASFRCSTATRSSGSDFRRHDPARTGRSFGSHASSSRPTR